MNFDTPPQALTICGAWNKIFEDTWHKRQAALDCHPDGTLRGQPSSPPCRKCKPAEG